jgi:hypothetical protein
LTSEASQRAPCSNTGEQGRREEISDKDPGGGGDLDGVGGGVLASLGEGHLSAEGERECLVPLLSSIGGYQRVREKNPKKAQKMGYEMVINAK